MMAEDLNSAGQREESSVSLSTRDETTSAANSSILSENDEICILSEIVGAYHLRSDSYDDIQPFAIIKLGKEVIHKTGKAVETGRNPIWTISSKSLFLIKTTPRELVHNDLHVSLWTKRKDPLNLTTLETCFLGQASVDCSTIVSNCNEERVEVEIFGKPQNGTGERPSRGTLTLRFRLATASDEKFLDKFEKRPELMKQESSRDLVNAKQQENALGGNTTPPVDTSSVRPIAPLVTEIDQTTIAGESLFKSLGSAFTSKRYFDKKSNQQKVLVKPHPDPERVDQTTYMTSRDFKKETLAPSRQWIEAGTGNLGKLYLEILSCSDLPNVDVGEAVGNFTDCFICAVFEDTMVQTPVIDDELSPHWLPWTQRAFIIGMMHPASILYLGAFDFDLGISDHEAIGRVAVNISNLQRDTDYTLKYNLYPSSNVTDRTANGSISIRLRIEYENQKEAVLAALRPRPKFHVSVRKEKSLKVVHYTCFGEYGDSNEQKFDLTVTRSYVNELLEYKRALSYCLGDAVRSLIFWRGQVKVFDMMLPIHSYLFFWAATVLVERPYLAPSFLVISIGWIMLAMQTQMRQHPSPWHRCPSVKRYVEALRTGKSSLWFQQIAPNEGLEESEKFDKEWKERLEKDQITAAKQVEFQQQITSIGDDSIQTKLATGGIPLELLERLGRYQGMIGRYCGHCRFIKIILTWEESIISFWITACFLVVGLVSLLLPWAFILLWTGRIVVWGFLGPHMMLVDLYLKSKSKEDKVLDLMVEKFKEQSQAARLRHQEALKLKDIKCRVFGDYITQVPNYNLSRHYDRPLPQSFAKLHSQSESADIKIAPQHIPGQQFFGVMVPRSQQDALRYEKELPKLHELLGELEDCVRTIQENDNAQLLNRLKSLGSDNEDRTTSVGYELLSYEKQDGDSQAHVQLAESSAVDVDSESHLAVLSTGERVKVSMRGKKNTRRSTMRFGYELIPFGEEGETEGESSLPMSDSSVLLLNSEFKLAVLQTKEEKSSLNRSTCQQKGVGTTGSTQEATKDPALLSELPILEDYAEEGVEVVMSPTKEAYASPYPAPSDEEPVEDTRDDETEEDSGTAEPVDGSKSVCVIIYRQ